MVKVQHRIGAIFIVGLDRGAQLRVIAQANVAVAQRRHTGIDEEGKNDVEGVFVAIITTFAEVIFFGIAVRTLALVAHVTFDARTVGMAAGAVVAFFIGVQHGFGLHAFQALYEGLVIIFVVGDTFIAFQFGVNFQYIFGKQFGIGTHEVEDVDDLALHRRHVFGIGRGIAFQVLGLIPFSRKIRQRRNFLRGSGNRDQPAECKCADH